MTDLTTENFTPIASLLTARARQLCGRVLTHDAMMQAAEDVGSLLNPPVSGKEVFDFYAGYLAKRRSETKVKPKRRKKAKPRKPVAKEKKPQEKPVKSLRNIAKAAQAAETFAELKTIFASANENLIEYGPARVDTEGTVVVDGQQFTYVDGSLRLIGFCQKCRMEVPSGPIRKFADVASLMDAFKPGRHECMDVD